MSASNPCAPSPESRRDQAQSVGKELVRRHGRQKYYAPWQVRDAHVRMHIPLDFVCWSHALFTTRAEFDEHHTSLGEACDYGTMRSQMLGSISSSSHEPSWWNPWLDLSWLDLPDIDWSIFDLLDW